jgi:integrase/recombinase XerD
MSPLRQTLKEYLAVRRALGFKLRDSGFALTRFVDFAEAHDADFITTQLALTWAQQPVRADPARWARRLGIVRLFARYCAGLDSRTEVPAERLLPHASRRKPPHLYSDAEILRLLEAARTLPSRTGLRAATYETLFGLMAVTGMRTREPIGLDRDDVDFSEGVITIRHSKFGKSRCVPLDPSTQRALQNYQLRRDQLCPHPRTPAFFLAEHGSRVTPSAMQWTFRKLSFQIGLRKPAHHRDPRLHDLRHSFAVRTLLSWYRSGLDVERQVPKLATYLGHTHVRHTYWYLSATPELLQQAVLRLENESQL